MPLTQLTNAEWGFDSMCFVCEPANEMGLRIPFFLDEATGVVSAEFTLTEAFSGAPAFVHGGVLMALCDEAMCWVTIAVARTWALTASNTHRFRRPVRLGRPYRVEGQIVGRDEEGIRTSAMIASATSGRVATEAEALFSPLGSAQAKRAIGTEVPLEYRDFVKLLGSDKSS